jgi:isoamylase
MNRRNQAAPPPYPGHLAHLQGRSAPLGASVMDGGVNFSVFSKHSVSMQLLLFDREDDRKPARVFDLDPTINRTHQYWHAFVPGIGAGQIYAFRAQGPFLPERGLRFASDKVLLDPYGRAVLTPKGYDRQEAAGPGDNCRTAMKNVVTDVRQYDWEGDQPLRLPFSRTVIYEMHVRGFTKHSSSGVTKEKRGSYAGLIEKIPYLKDLGITAVELLPVFQFDAQDARPGLTNYWGYSPASFFAPHDGYSSKGGGLPALDEFRDMVKALHRAGIEVILDVVYNHTAEGDETGPNFCFKGLANDAYYILEKDRARYANFTGTGNTLNANHPIVRRLIRDSLHFWVEEMHVDGFRFDLASILSRDEDGHPHPNPPVLWDIDSDPILADTKIIAEAWDAAGLYQVGSFVGDRWKEWNGRFRDDVRSFLRGDRDSVAGLPHRLLGSPDIYGHAGREPEQSVNFVTCHDGFTINDWVSYNHKHNQANGEESRDGADDNRSWNCGMEGPSKDPKIEQLRNQQVKNALFINLISVGTPMLLMGDEVRRSQKGNNNAYCQDNGVSWFDWTLLDRHPDIHRFVRMLIVNRLKRQVRPHRGEWTLAQMLKLARMQVHGVKLNEPDRGPDSHSIALTVWLFADGLVLHMMLNAFWEPLEFELPPTSKQHPEPWCRWVDTSMESPNDIVDLSDAPPIIHKSYLVPQRSIAVVVRGAMAE